MQWEPTRLRYYEGKECSFESLNAGFVPKSIICKAQEILRAGGDFLQYSSFPKKHKTCCFHTGGEWGMGLGPVRLESLAEK